jgi:hypothetical protein
VLPLGYRFTGVDNSTATAVGASGGLALPDLDLRLHDGIVSDADSPPVEHPLIGMSALSRPRIGGRAACSEARHMG